MYMGPAWFPAPLARRRSFGAGSAVQSWAGWPPAATSFRGRRPLRTCDVGNVVLSLALEHGLQVDPVVVEDVGRDVQQLGVDRHALTCGVFQAHDDVLAPQPATVVQCR